MVSVRPIQADRREVGVVGGRGVTGLGGIRRGWSPFTASGQGGLVTPRPAGSPLASILRIWSANASASYKAKITDEAGATRSGAGDADLKALRPRRRDIVGEHSTNVARLGSRCTPTTLATSRSCGQPG
jgi:hypothetical protein